MSYRANKSGFAAEAQKKIDSNFNEEEANKCLFWIQLVSGCEEIPTTQSAINASPDNFHELLKDGLILLKLADKLVPGKINWNDKMFQTPKIEAMKVMRERERIAKFGTMIMEFGVKETYTFPTESLHEKGALNLAQVCVCIRAVGIEAQNKQFGPQGYWPKKSQKNVREFTDEQLKAGANVTSLQYGTNKGASQAGMSMGKQRHILD